MVDVTLVRHYRIEKFDLDKIRNADLNDIKKDMIRHIP